jgi:hypothetical protein
MAGKKSTERRTLNAQPSTMPDKESPNMTAEIKALIASMGR